MFGVAGSRLRFDVVKDPRPVNPDRLISRKSGSGSVRLSGLEVAPHVGGLVGAETPPCHFGWKLSKA